MKSLLPLLLFFVSCTNGDGGPPVRTKGGLITSHWVVFAGLVYIVAVTYYMYRKYKRVSQ